jgi:hypothetical protein
MSIAQLKYEFLGDFEFYLKTEKKIAYRRVFSLHRFQNGPGAAATSKAIQLEIDPG